MRANISTLELFPLGVCPFAYWIQEEQLAKECAQVLVNC